MDIDVMGKHIHGLLAFKDKLEGLMSGADENVSRATDQLDELVAFKAGFEHALPDLEKAINDVAAVVDDVGKIKADLAPALAWIAEQQQAIDAAKAAEEQKAAEAAKAQQQAEADHAAKGAAEKPPETPAADPVKPLEHLAEVETALDAGAEPAARSESEQPSG